MTHARIKLSNFSVVSMGALPADLDGLRDSSLADLAWTDPALGYRGNGFWPIDLQSAPLFDPREQLVDGETTVVDKVTKRVSIIPVVRDFTDDEKAALPPLPTPEPISLGKLQFIVLAQTAGGMTDAMLVEAQRNSAFAAFWIKYQMASGVERDDPITAGSLDALQAGGYLPNGKAAVLEAWPVG